MKRIAIILFLFTFYNSPVAAQQIIENVTAFYSQGYVNIISVSNGVISEETNTFLGDFNATLEYRNIHGDHWSVKVFEHGPSVPATFYVDEERSKIILSYGNTYYIYNLNGSLAYSGLCPIKTRDDCVQFLRYLFLNNKLEAYHVGIGNCRKGFISYAKRMSFLENDNLYYNTFKDNNSIELNFGLSQLENQDSVWCLWLTNDYKIKLSKSNLELTNGRTVVHDVDTTKAYTLVNQKYLYKDKYLYVWAFEYHRWTKQELLGVKRGDIPFDIRTKNLIVLKFDLNLNLVKTIRCNHLPIIKYDYQGEEYISGNRSLSLFCDRLDYGIIIINVQTHPYKVKQYSPSSRYIVYVVDQKKYYLVKAGVEKDLLLYDFQQSKVDHFLKKYCEDIVE